MCETKILRRRHISNGAFRHFNILTPHCSREGQIFVYVNFALKAVQMTFGNLLYIIASSHCLKHLQVTKCTNIASQCSSDNRGKQVGKQVTWEPNSGTNGQSQVGGKQARGTQGLIVLSWMVN